MALDFELDLGFVGPDFVLYSRLLGLDLGRFGLKLDLDLRLCGFDLVLRPFGLDVGHVDLHFILDLECVGFDLALDLGLVGLILGLDS